MPNAALTPDDEAYFRAVSTDADATLKEFDRAGADLARGYGGQWVAFHGARVLAHSADPDQVRAALEGIGKDGETALVRFVPTADSEFAFAE